LAQKPTWDRPEVRQGYNEAAREEIQQLLATHELNHLSVLSRGRHVVIYSAEVDEKVYRLRFARIGHGRYELNIANHRGVWEPTPFTGTISELFDIVATQFPWVLADL
jgi:hypothetical protein